MKSQTFRAWRMPSSRRLPLFITAFVLVWFFFNSFSFQSREILDSPRKNSYSVIPGKNYAFSAFLAAPTHESEEDNDDLYFVGTRMMIYQLLHDPETRTNHSYPFVVLVTEDVSISKRERLAKDGAIVKPVEKLSLGWAKVRKQWQDVLTKLRLFELTEYDKVLFLDSDMLITRRIDGIFEDPAADIQQNRGDTSEKTSPADEGEQPSEYIWAGNSGSGGYDHAYPTPPGSNPNAGCMVFKPSKVLFEYYLRLAELKDRFNGRTPEQSLWGYAHRRNGNMPWKQLHYDWNVNWATWRDYKHGIASLHSKFWELDHDKDLRDFAMSIRWKMEGYWLGRDEKS